MLLDERRKPAEQPRPVGRRDVTPAGEGGLCPCDSVVQFLDPGLLELGDRLLRGGVQDGERHGYVRSDSVRVVPGLTAVSDTEFVKRKV